jgi:RecB family exonuclease
VADDDGRARSPSPFVERLRGAGAELPCEQAPSLQAPPERSRGWPRTAAEAAVTEALHGSRARFSELLPLAVRERAAFEGAAGPAAPPDALARARLAVREEFADRPGRAELGPYFGFVGPVRSAADPRRREIYVTLVESLARCPWQVFLSRLLGLEPPPDALAGLPELGPLLIGSLVHRVLQEIVAREIPQAPCADEAARAVPWPAEPELEALLRSCAAALLREEGLGPPGLAQLLVESARPLVAAARGLEWPAPGSGIRCLGAEVEDRVEVPGPDSRRWSVGFRADRVDLTADGRRWIDYKTGRAPRGTLLERVAQGASLQAAAYAFGGGGEGRFLFLARGAERGAVVGVDAEDRELRAAFDAAISAALAAFEAGSFLPRLAKADGSGPPDPCDWCEVREACLQGDAGARARLVEWAKQGRAGADAEGAALALWRLHAEERG